jgi:hypothetical protein
VVSEGTGIEGYVEQWVGSSALGGGSNGDLIALKVESFTTHAEFTTNLPNVSLGPAAKRRIPVGPAFHATEKNATAMPLPYLSLIRRW